jgi:hypothetical protein
VHHRESLHNSTNTFHFDGEPTSGECASGDMQYISQNMRERLNTCSLPGFLAISELSLYAISILDVLLKEPTDSHVGSGFALEFLEKPYRSPASRINDETGMKTIRDILEQEFSK